ncbi:MAG TPA: cytochrome c oxidase assembly protein [Chloroflexota bacterium]|nr:cytochrome c oxidase assembly protein [Chloroflexota bacterium]
MTAWSPASWSFEPGVVGGIGALSLAYIIGVWRARPRSIWDEHVVSVGEATAFGSAIILLVIALISPLDTLSSYLFSAHMLQHMLLVYIVPPLLLAGTPRWLLEPLLEAPRVRDIARAVTGPIPAIIIFNVILVIWHMPEAWQAALVDNQIHAFEHLCFLGAGIIAWFPIFSPVRVVPRLSYPGQMVYLFVQSLVPAVVGAFITFSGSVIYPLYSGVPKPWGLSPLVDQQLAGLLMKLLGTIFLWILVSVRFFQWFGHEEHEIEKIVDDSSLSQTS